MLMNKKRMLLLATALAIVTIGAVYAAFNIYSNVEHVSINYTLALSHTVFGSNVRLTAHLESLGSPVSGVTVYFYTCDSGGGSRVAIGSNTTDIHGNALWTSYSATGNGDYYFIAEYDVP